MDYKLIVYLFLFLFSVSVVIFGNFWAGLLIKLIEYISSFFIDKTLSRESVMNEITNVNTENLRNLTKYICQKYAVKNNGQYHIPTGISLPNDMHDFFRNYSCIDIDDLKIIDISEVKNETFEKEDFIKICNDSDSAYYVSSKDKEKAKIYYFSYNPDLWDSDEKKPILDSNSLEEYICLSYFQNMDTVPPELKEIIEELMTKQ